MNQNLISAGWNDPPEDIISRPHITNRLIKQRRPVDPSIQVFILIYVF